MRRLGACALLLLALAMSGCTTTTKVKATPTPTSAVATPTATPFTTDKLAWTSCNGGFQCSKLKVPLNYADPSDTRQITVALIRLPALDQAHRIGSILVNPGGPGGSGIQFLREGALLFAGLGEQFDLVSFDPRGVGDSSPIRCFTAKEMDAFIAVDPVPTTQAQIDAAIAASKNLATKCAQRNPTTLGFIGTNSAARDMDRIRDALGDAKLNYIGFSYGTLLGATYADLFPQNVRALVLDGALDPALTADDTSRAQAVGFERNLTAFLDDCARRTTCAFYNGGKPGPALDKLLARITTKALPAGTRKLGVGEAYIGLLAGLYQPAAWSALASALHTAQAGNGKQLLAFTDSYTARRADGTYSNELDANTAINCDDGPPPGSITHIEQLGADLQKVAPHFGLASAFGPLTCEFWPTLPTGRHVLTAAGAPPILVIGGTNDPATPYAWAQNMARELKSAILVTRTGDGHVSYDKSSCIRNIVNSFMLNTNQLPASGTVCASDPGGF